MRKKPFLPLFVAIILLTAVLFQAALADEAEPLPVFAFADGATFTADDSDQPVLLFWGWFTRTRGQIKVFHKHAYQTFVLTGPNGTVFDLSAQESQAYWGVPFKLSPDFFGEVCPNGLLWGNRWQLDLGILPPGAYTLQSRMVFEKPVNDGAHTCTFDGQPVSPSPSLYRPGEELATVTIIVPGP